MAVAAMAAATRPWLKSYPPGVPAEIDLDALGTLVDLELNYNRNKKLESKLPCLIRGSDILSYTLA